MKGYPIPLPALVFMFVIGSLFLIADYFLTDGFKLGAFLPSYYTGSTSISVHPLIAVLLMAFGAALVLVSLLVWVLAYSNIKLEPCEHDWVLDKDNSGIRRCTLCKEEQWFMQNPFPEAGEPATYWKTRHPGHLHP